jgi:hypothetical protein
MQFLAKPLLLAACILLAFAGCNTSTTQAQLTPDKDTLIELSRGPCWRDACSVYTVTIKGDGTVNLTGSKVTPSGKQELKGQGSISQARLRELVSEFERINFFTLKDEYKTEGPDCPNYGTDSPTAFISIQVGGKSKSVKHYLGCMGTDTLNDLNRLEEKIDEVANTKQWLK